MAKINESTLTGLLIVPETLLLEQKELESQGGKTNNKIPEVTGPIKVDLLVSKRVCLLWIFSFSGLKQYTDDC